MISIKREEIGNYFKIYDYTHEFIGLKKNLRPEFAKWVRSDPDMMTSWQNGFLERWGGDGGRG